MPNPIPGAITITKFPKKTAAYELGEKKCQT